MWFPYLLAAATAALSVAAPGFKESPFLYIRQSIAPGSPLYECHANCGGVIEIAQVGGDFCSNSTFISDLSACLNCALTYDIWQYYGVDVAKAAEGCGNNASPSPSSVVSSTTATAPPTTATAVSSGISTEESTVVGILTTVQTSPVSTVISPSASTSPIATLPYTAITTSPSGSGLPNSTASTGLATPTPNSTSSGHCVNLNGVWLNLVIASLLASSLGLAN